VGGVACDGVEAKRQERREQCGVVDRAGRDAQSERSESCDQRAREEEVLDAHAVEPDASPPRCERVYAVVADGDQSRPKAELGCQLACTGPEADHLGPLPRRVVAKALAERSGGAACEGWVGVRLDLELERRVGRRALKQLVEQQRALVARSAVSVAEPARADLRRGALVGPTGQRRGDLEKRVVQQHELAVAGQAAVRLEAVEWPLECAGERRGRRVGAVGAAEAVGVKRRRHHRNCGDQRALGGYASATIQ